MIRVIADGAMLTLENAEELTTGCEERLCVGFDFSEDWDRYRRTVIFTNGDNRFLTVTEGDVCEVPPGALSEPGELFLSVRGSYDESTVSSGVISLGFIHDALATVPTDIPVPAGNIELDTAGETDVFLYATATVKRGAVGIPTAAKGAVTGHSMSITPSVTSSAGFIPDMETVGTPVTVSAAELVSGTKELAENGTFDVAEFASALVNVPLPHFKKFEVTVPSKTAGSVRLVFDDDFTAHYADDNAVCVVMPKTDFTAPDGEGACIMAFATNKSFAGATGTSFSWIGLLAQANGNSAIATGGGRKLNVWASGSGHLGSSAFSDSRIGVVWSGNSTYPIQPGEYVVYFMW